MWVGWDKTSFHENEITWKEKLRGLHIVTKSMSPVEFYVYIPSLNIAKEDDATPVITHT